MVKIIILLDCDECGKSFSKANVFSQMRTEADLPITTQLSVLRLKQHSELANWEIMGDYTICPECLSEQEKMDDWLQEPEEYRELG